MDSRLDSEVMVLNGALALPVDERGAYIEQACAGDPELRKRVAALLRAHQRAGSFLQKAAAEAASARDDSSSAPGGRPGAEVAEKGRLTEMAGERAGTQIGRYRLLEQIGEGGCGIVYLAAQDEPVRRQVALKIIKLGMDTKSVVARFEMERQTLAMMEHPNIAKVLDAGATEAGRPFFVMELVRGTKITDYCNEHNLALTERLDLFVQICRAVQHAHQKGIIHRDLKPSNVLVTFQDSDKAAVPKVIDFGIAKATQGRLTDETAFTAVEQFIGTPAYMSPEQAGMSPDGVADVDTRSDIYSLGVLLYELLTSQTPFDANELHEEGLGRLRRTILEQEPGRPSSKLAAEPARAVKGDLDCIVMKCLEKDRTRRYATANGLAADIERHLKNEPISARPPGNIYAMRKFARRNRPALAVAGALGLGMMVTLVALAVGNVRIRNERNQRELALKEKGAALDTARQSEEQARKQLFISLKSQAQARRYSAHMGQRVESLSALAEAARIKPDPALRDEAIAAMALQDLRPGLTWSYHADGMEALDPFLHRSARVDKAGIITIRTVPDDRPLSNFAGLPLGPGQTVSLLVFAPQSDFLAERLPDGRLQVWGLTQTHPVFPKALSNCLGIGFSPNGKLIAVGQTIVEAGPKTNFFVRSFDLSTGAQLHSWQVPARIYSLAFSPDSRRLAAGYVDSTVISVFHEEMPTPMVELPIENSSLETVTWHPDGKHLAAAGSDPRIQIWDVEARKLAAVLQGHSQQVTFLSFHPNGELLASTSWDNVFRLWQPTPGRQLMQIYCSGRIQFSTDGQSVGVIFPSADQAQQLEALPSQEYHTFIGGFGGAQSGSFDGDVSANGQLLAIGCEDGTRLWDVNSGIELTFLPLGSTLSVLWQPNGSFLTCGPESGLQQWPVARDSATTKPVLGKPHQFNLPLVPSRAAKSEDPNTIALVDEHAGEAAILNLDTGSLSNLRFAHPHAGYIDISPDGHWLVTSGWHAVAVRLWNAQTAEMIKEFPVGNFARASFTPDGKELIISLSDEFRFINISTLEVGRAFHRKLGLWPGEVAFARDLRLMAVELEAGIIDLKEFASGRTVARFEDPSGDVSTWAAFTPDGAQLISAARHAGAIHRWDFRAIRQRLKAMGLDWDWPEFAPIVKAN